MGPLSSVVPHQYYRTWIRFHGVGIGPCSMPFGVTRSWPAPPCAAPLGVTRCRPRPLRLASWGRRPTDLGFPPALGLLGSHAAGPGPYA